MIKMAIVNTGYILVLVFCTVRHCIADIDFRLHPINGVKTDNILEAKFNGIWRAVISADYKFSEGTAKVVCNHFGYGYIGYSGVLTSTEYNYTGGIWYVPVFDCEGNATELRECVDPAYENRTIHLQNRRIPRIKCSEFKVSTIRLTGGEVPSKGRLEILVGTQWGTVCTYTARGAYSLSTANENGICQMLGYFNSLPGFYTSQLTNNASTPVLMTLEGCSNLNSVDFEKHCNVIKGEYPYCHFHQFDALLSCEAIRLVDPNAYSGRIETSINGSLVTLCDHLFDIKSANVACNMLGYSGAKRVISSTQYGTGVFPLYSGRISCNGDEKSLEQCHHETLDYSPCNSQRIVGVVCQGGPMKLEPFANKVYEGIFAASHNDIWYHFSGNISDRTAKTLCNMTGFGFRGYGISLPQDVWTQEFVYQDIQTQSLQCFGNETNVVECTSEPFKCLHSTRHSCHISKHGVLGLYCNDYTVEDVRLKQLWATPYINQGLFEVFVDGEWGSFAELGMIEAKIVCKNLGFFDAVKTFKLSEPYRNQMFKLIGVMRCTGNESSPFDCDFQHQGYLGSTDIGATLVDCSTDCREDRYGIGICDKECKCILANTENCDDVSGECTCNPGWTGTHCETDVNECLTPNICPYGSDCVNQIGSYECSCRPGTMMSDDSVRCKVTAQ